MGEKSCDRKIFLDRTPKTSTKEKIDKLSFLKIESFYFQKSTVTKMKR